MKAEYIAVYRIHGINSLCDAGETHDLAMFVAPKAEVKLTTEPDPFCLHIDTALAIAHELLRGLFGPYREGSPEERVARQIAEVRAARLEKHGTGVYLVLSGAHEVLDPDLSRRSDLKDASICIEAYPKDAIRTVFRPLLHGVLTAIGLVLPERADLRLGKVGDVSYMVDPTNGRPIYSFSFGVGDATAVLSCPLSVDSMLQARRMAKLLPFDSTAVKVAGLVVESHQDGLPNLNAFIAAWSALEILVSATFKEMYEKKWFEILESGAPASSQPYFGRLQDVMRDKHRLSDKFLIIASILDHASAESDWVAFSELKTARDKMFHGAKTERNFNLPVERVQNLVRKYVRLHLEYKCK